MKTSAILRMTLTGLGLSLLQPAQAATCNAPDLAPGYCDANGDMVADTPEDKSQWLDPNPLVLGDVPTSDMKTRAERVAPFVQHLEKALGRKVTYFVAKDYADLVTAYRANRVHLVNINTGNIEKEVRCHGYVPVAQPIDAKGNIDGAQAELIVPAQSPIKQPRELKGHTIAFVEESSNSGYKTPRVILAQEFGLVAGKDYQTTFSGRHDNSILGVANGIYDAAAIGSTIRRNLIRDRLLEPSAVRVIYVSRTFPNSPWGVSHRLHPVLLKTLQGALVSYAGPENALPHGNRFKAANYRSDWAYVREISAALSGPTKCD